MKITTQNEGGGSKIKILALSAKLNQILYTYSVDPQKARNAKTNHQKWGGGIKNENSRPFDKIWLSAHY